jgi:hypothetical protein
MTLKKLNSFNFKHIKDFKKISLNEISVIKGETSLKNINRDVIRILNSVVNIINYK